MSIGASVPHTSGAKATSSAVPAKAARKTASAPRNSGRRSGIGLGGRARGQPPPAPAGEEAARPLLPGGPQRVGPPHGGEQAERADERRPAGGADDAVGHERRAPPEPHEPRHEHEPQDLAEAEAAAREPAERRAGQRRAGQPDHLDQRPACAVPRSRRSMVAPGPVVRVATTRVRTHAALRPDRRPAARDRGLRARRARAAVQPGVRAAHDGGAAPAAAARRGSGRTSPTTWTTSCASRRPGPVLPLAGSWTVDSFSRHLGGLDLFGGSPPWHAGLPPLPPLGVRVGRGRPGPAPGGPLARRRAGAGAAAGRVRRLAPPGRAAERRARRAPRGRLSGRALQARRHAELGRRAARAPAGHGRGGLDRLQGRLQGHAGRRPDRPRRSTRAARRPSRTRGWRTRT